MDPKLEAILMDHQAAYAEAEVYSDWMPDPGDYLVSVKSIKEGSRKDEETGKVHVWVRVTATIQADSDPTNNGKDFSLGFVGTHNPSGMKTLATEMTGIQHSDAISAINAMHEKVGCLYQVKVSKSYSKKRDQTYTNCHITSAAEPKVEAAATV